jgi:hypothetical protein
MKLFKPRNHYYNNYLTVVPKTFIIANTSFFTNIIIIRTTFAKIAFVIIINNISHLKAFIFTFFLMKGVIEIL